MSDPNSELKLALDFSAATREDWRKLVDGVLKGRPFEKLVSKTYDELRIEPLYSPAAYARPLAGRMAASWQILQRIEHPDAAAANAQALQDLENGATGLSLVFGGAVGSYDHGIAASEDALARVLDGVHLDAGIVLELDLSPFAKKVAGDIGGLLQGRGLAAASAEIRFGFDPLGAMAHNGWTPLRWKDMAPLFATLIADLAGAGFKGPFAAADARPVHAAGGSEAQELAFALAVAVTYLRAMEKGGIALDTARRMIFFRLAADADQFLSIAKFRALRKLWMRVEEACELTPASAFVAAETAWRMMTRRDPHVNILRTTMAAFSAALGGANAITVLPFTAALGLPDPFARRLARNTQLLLMEEAHIAKVTDPGAGSGAIEDLTLQLCHAAWQLFQEIERAGGAAAALESSLLQDKVAAIRAERESAVAHRTDVLTGTTEFPNIAEAPVSVLDAAPISLPPPPPNRIEVKPLPCVRLAEPFERLRDASDRMLAASGSRPKIFLANLGHPSDFVARARFAKNFFESGGIEVVTNDGFAVSPLPVGERSAPQAPDEGVSRPHDRNPSSAPPPSAVDRAPATGEVKTNFAALVAAFKASGTKLACLCSADQVYAREALDAAKTLVRAGASHIYLAGRPYEQEPSLRKAGVQTFIYAGCDALATLQTAHDMLAIKA